MIEEARERAGGRLAGGELFGEIPARGRLVALVFAQQPEAAARALDQLRQRPQHALAQLTLHVAAGQGLGEAQPFLAVVVFVLEEMLADIDAQARAQLAGKEQYGEHEGRAEQEDDLRHHAPFATLFAHVVATEAHGQQIQAGAEQGGGVQDDMPRDEDVLREARVAHQPHREYRHHQGVDEAAGDPQCALDAGHQHGVGVEVEIEGVEPADAAAKILERAPILALEVAVELFEQREDNHGEDQVTGDERVHGTGEERQRALHGAQHGERHEGGC